MRVDKDDRYISEQPNKDSTPSVKLPDFLQDFAKKKKLIILGLVIIILLLLSLIIFNSSHKKTETLLTPSEINGVISTEETNDTITDEPNVSGINENQTRGTNSITETSLDNDLNEPNTQLESFGNTNDSLNSPTNNQNKGYKANHHTATSNGRTIASKTDTKKDNHNLVNSKNENIDLEKNIKIKNDHYVIQLSASKSLEGLKKFIKQNNITDYHIYQSKHESGLWFVLIKGNYSSVDEANKAIKSLPSALQKHKPWVKSGATINKEKVTK